MEQSLPSKRQACKTKGLRIAIDGPAAAGKSTAARKIAGILGYTYLDTGAMYRALALLAVGRGISLYDPRALGEMASFVHMEAREDNGIFRVWIDGEEFTHKLRTPEADKAVKLIAMAEPVRKVLVDMQQNMARNGRVVMEGRDITSVVIPDAEVKVFLTACLSERARRRWLELRKKGIHVSFDEVLQEIKARDAKDLEREWGKLVKVEGAEFIDSTFMSIEEVCRAIIALCGEKSTCFTRCADGWCV